MTRFLLIRHGSTNMVGKRFSGRMPDVHLDENGKQQANEIAQRLKSLPIKAIYSSPLERAIETAVPLSKELNLQVQTSEEFTEIDCGEWTGKEIDELREDRKFQLFNSFRSIAPVSGGEWMAEAQLRMVKQMQNLCLIHPGETIVIVSHSDLIKAAIAYYAGIHLDLFQRIEIDPASVSIITVYDETARINLLNHVGDIL
jgi:probable phosphomutase (TIGR03848 family)